MKNSRVFDAITQRFNLTKCNKDTLASIKKLSNNFCAQVKNKWLKCHRMESKVLLKYSEWLNGVLNLPDDVLNSKTPVLTPSTSYSDLVKRSKRGRPRQQLFEESSVKTKKRRVASLLTNASHEELMFASQISLRSKGRRDAANILHEISASSPTKATKIKKAYTLSKEKETCQLSSEEALALFIDAKLTKRQYMMIRLKATMRNFNLYPPYKCVLKAKKECYPEERAISITEISAEITLQGLLDHTIRRLILVQKDVLVQIEHVQNEPLHLKLMIKWGCDGASGHSTYKQQFANESEGERRDDANLFVISLVPLQMIATSEQSTSKGLNKIVVWQNVRPSSTRYCRPIKLLFQKETVEFTRQQIGSIQNEIDNLIPTEFMMEGRQIIVTSVLSMTMVDGKICSAVTEKSSQVCYICGATPRQMNDLQKCLLRKADALPLTFGISSLHAWIRFFECLLHIAYRLDVKTWQVRKRDRELVDARKRVIQDKFRMQMGLLVDIPKPGSGTTNDGNTARKFFSNFALSSLITGIDERLIKRFAIIYKPLRAGLMWKLLLSRNMHSKQPSCI